MEVIRERDSFREPCNARGRCSCGCEFELPLESGIYIPCPGCHKLYNCDGQLYVEDPE